MGELFLSDRYTSNPSLDPLEAVDLIAGNISQSIKFGLSVYKTLNNDSYYDDYDDEEYDDYDDDY